jgi:hypothetical protein
MSCAMIPPLRRCGSAQHAAWQSTTLRLRRCAAVDLRNLRDDLRLLHCTTN